MNRLAFISGHAFSSGRLSKWRLTDVVLLAVLVLVNYPVYYQEPFQRQFTVNDLTISHPYAEHQRVSDTMLFVYCFLVPLVTILAVWMVLADQRHKWFLLYKSVLGLSLAVATDAFLTNFIKNWIGRLRPDFLARCQPRADTPLNILVYAKDVCTTTDRNKLLDGFRTTPSGHSSESFAGLGYLYLWLCGQLVTENAQTELWRKYIAFIPLLGATLIALSRTQDYRHHFVDVILGAILGFVLGHFSYRQYFPSIYSEVPFTPLQDDSGVTLMNYEPPSSGNLDEEAAQPLTNRPST